MSIASLMIHTCTIVRDSSTGEDPLGNPEKLTETNVYSGICRLVERQERVWDDAKGIASKVTTYNLLIPCGTVIQERDRIKDVTLEDGTKIENYYAVKSVLVRRTTMASHLSIILERVG